MAGLFFHGFKILGHDQVRFGSGLNLFDGEFGVDFRQHDAFRGNLHDAHFGYDHVHGAFGRQRQRTFLEDFGCAFGRVLHGKDHLVGTREQVHRTAHAGSFLARDDPVGQGRLFHRPARLPVPKRSHDRRG